MPKANLEIVQFVKKQRIKEYQTKEGAVWRVKLADLREVTGADPAGFPVSV